MKTQVSLLFRKFWLVIISFALSASFTLAKNITTSDDDKQFVEQQLIDLRLNTYLEINSAKKVSEQLYEVSVSGLGGKEKGSLLYRGSKGDWILIIRTENSFHEFIQLRNPVYFFTTQDGVIQLDENTPDVVKNFLAPYKDLGRSIPLDAGASFSGIWDPMEVSEDAAQFIEMVGLNKIASSQNPGAENGLLIRGTYNYLANADVIMKIVTDLGALPTIPGQPDAFKMKQQSVDLALQCKLTASLDFIKRKSFLRFDETDCELKMETEVRVDINSDHVFFDAAVGFRSIKRANSRAANEEVAKRAKMLGFDPNKSTAVFIEGDIRGGVWKNIFGLKGFNMQEVKLQTLIDKETGWHVGVFGQIDFGSQTRMTAAALIPVGASGESFSNIALEASLDKITLEELAMLPAVLGGPKTYPKEWTKNIHDAGLNHFGMQNVKFTFAPSISDPDLGIDQSGTTVTGSLIGFNQTLSSLKVYANKDGIYFDDVVEPFKIGWFELKNARFKGFIPSKNQKNKDGSERARKKLDYAGQNIFVLFFDTFMEIDGNRERALVSFTPLHAGIEFDVNITKEFGMGFKLMLPIANIANAQWPFDVSARMKSNQLEFANQMRKNISNGINEEFQKADKSYKAQIDAINTAQDNLKVVKEEYEKARAAAQARADKALAPLKKAEEYLNKKNDHEKHLHHEYEHWKHKAKHTSWLHPKDKVHAYWEESKYWAEYEAYKAEVAAAKLAVESLEATTEFIAVDADPDVVNYFSAYNGAKFTLAIAKGALTAEKKANAYVEGLVDEVLKESFKGFEITDIKATGTSAASGKFDLTFSMSGTAYGDNWEVTSGAQLYSPKDVEGFFLALIQQNQDNQQSAAFASWDATKAGAENLKTLAALINPLSKSIVAHSKSLFHGSDYAQYPPNAQLAYSWQKLVDGGDAVDIAAGKEFVFVNNTKGLVWFWKDDKWQRVPEVENVKRIAIASTMDYPVLVTNDGRLWQWNKSTKKWDRDSQATSVADVGVGPKGTIWITNSAGKIWRKEAGKNWEEMPGSDVVRITVDDKENAWVINTDTHIYHWKGTEWEMLEGEAVDIGFGNNQVWVIGMSDSIWHFIPGTGKWVRITGQGTNISVDANGLPWIVSSSREIWKNNGPK